MQERYFSEAMRKQLKVGTNVIAVRSFLQYFNGKEGALDVHLEGLRELPDL